MKPLIRLLKYLSAFAAFVLLLAGTTGCATTGDRDSELPWNAPQPWEGSPMIPGLNQGR